MSENEAYYPVFRHAEHAKRFSVQTDSADNSPVIENKTVYASDLLDL